MRKRDASERLVGTTTQHSEVLARHTVWHSYIVMSAASFLTSYSAPHKIPTTSEVSVWFHSGFNIMKEALQICHYYRIFMPFKGDQHTVQHSGHGFKIIHNVRKEIKNCSWVYHVECRLHHVPVHPLHVTCNKRKANKPPCKAQHLPSQRAFHVPMKFSQSALPTYLAHRQE